MFTDRVFIDFFSLLNFLPPISFNLLFVKGDLEKYLTTFVAQNLIGLEEIVSSARQKITSKIEGVFPESVAISMANLFLFKTMMFSFLVVSVLFLFYELSYH